MLELVGQMLAYTGVGFVTLVGGFVVLDLLTPGRLGHMVMERHVNAAIIATSQLVSLGLVLWFAIFFTGAGWEGLDNVLVFSAVGVLAQVVGFFVLDMLTPGKLGDICAEEKFHPAAAVQAGVQLSVALVICASLT